MAARSYWSGRKVYWDAARSRSSITRPEEPTCGYPPPSPRALARPCSRRRVLAAAGIAGPWAAAARADDVGRARRQLLAEADRVASAGPYRPEWESLKTVPIPEWYLDGKFGIFIHWGLYSVPAFGNEWYPRNMYKADTPEFRHHVATYGPQAQFGYKDFIPRFTADKYDPARLGGALPPGRGALRGAGGRAPRRLRDVRHGAQRLERGEDGAEAGPRRRPREGGAREGPRLRPLDPPRRALVVLRPGDDVRLGRALEEVARLLRPRAAGEDARTARPNQPDREYLDDWMARTVELVEKYHPQLVWFDWWIEQPAFEPYLRRFAAYYYNHGAGRGEARRHQLQAQGLPRRRRRARRRARPARRRSAPSSGRPTRRSRRTPGAT